MTSWGLYLSQTTESQWCSRETSGRSRASLKHIWKTELLIPSEEHCTPKLPALLPYSLTTVSIFLHKLWPLSMFSLHYIFLKHKYNHVIPLMAFHFPEDKERIPNMAYSLCMTQPLPTSPVSTFQVSFLLCLPTGCFLLLRAFAHANHSLQPAVLTFHSPKMLQQELLHRCAQVHSIACTFVSQRLSQLVIRFLRICHSTELSPYRP